MRKVLKLAGMVSMIRTACGLLMVAALSACALKPSAPSSPGNALPETALLGSWEVESLTYRSDAVTHVLDPAHPGLLLITPQRYGIMWTPTRAARVPFAVLSKPTDAEILAGFRSIVFNGGSWQVQPESARSGVFITTAAVAKVPGFEGGVQYYRYAVSDDGMQMTFTMFDETYPDGSKPDWAGQWETQFVLRRVAGSPKGST